MSVASSGFDDRSPIYRQIAGQLRDAIAGGTLVDDEQVMSTNQYAAFHRINPATAAKAFQELVDDGLLYKRRGVGMFVSPGSGARLRSERRERFVDDVLHPVLEQAAALSIAPEEIIAAVRAHATAAATSVSRSPSPMKGSS